MIGSAGGIIVATKQKKLGTFDSVHLLIGGMIGSAIFSLSGMTILSAGPAAIISWILGALILLAYGLQTAELASRYPQSEGSLLFLPCSWERHGNKAIYGGGYQHGLISLVVLLEQPSQLSILVSTFQSRSPSWVPGRFHLGLLPCSSAEF